MQQRKRTRGEQEGDTNNVRRKESSRHSGVLLGTYHSAMAGIVFRDQKLLLKFLTKRHTGSVNHVATCDKYLASCGADERVFLFIKKRGGSSGAKVVVTDLGTLVCPAEVTHLAWKGTSHLLCGTSDGSLLVYRSRDWEEAFSVKVHEKAVVSIAIHHAGNSGSGSGTAAAAGGALVVTLGADRAIAVLDMTSGTLITKMKLQKGVEPRWVSFSPARAPSTDKSVSSSGGGEVFVVLSTHAIFLYLTRNASQLAQTAFEESQQQPENELHCAVFVGSDEMLVGLESGRLMVVRGVAPSSVSLRLEQLQLAVPALPAAAEEQEQQKREQRRQQTSHKARVKTLVRLRAEGGEGGASDDGDIVVSGDADGWLIAWRIERDDSGSVRQLAFVCSANCQGRITCAAAF